MTVSQPSCFQMTPLLWVCYKREVEAFVRWCDANFLKLNVGKTKELIIDFRRKREDLFSVSIKGQQVEVVET